MKLSFSTPLLLLGTIIFLSISSCNKEKSTHNTFKLEASANKSIKGSTANRATLLNKSGVSKKSNTSSVESCNGIIFFQGNFTTDNNSSSGQLFNGYFSYYLLEELNQLDPNGTYNIGTNQINWQSTSYDMSSAASVIVGNAVQSAISELLLNYGTTVQIVGSLSITASGGCNAPTNPDPDHDLELLCRDASANSQMQTDDELISVEAETETPNVRTRLYKWYFHKNVLNLWKYISKEKGTHVKVGNEWKWSNLEHVSESLEGVVAGGSLECLGMATNTIIGDYSSVMELDYTIKFTPIIDKCPFSVSTAFTSRKAFSSQVP